MDMLIHIGALFHYYLWLGLSLHIKFIARCHDATHAINGTFTDLEKHNIINNNSPTLRTFIMKFARAHYHHPNQIL